MPRVIGIDPGTVSLDICGLDDGRVFLDETIPTEDALADPSLILGRIDGAAPLDLVVGPSGYGLPLTHARDLTEKDIRLACLAPRGESSGIGGLSSLMRALASSSAPVVMTPHESAVVTPAAAPGLAPEPAPSASVPDPASEAPRAGGIAPKPSADIVVTIESSPRGATVILGGKYRGTTPVDLELPRDGTKVAFELREAGYEPLSQELVPDRDQKFVLSLKKKATRTKKSTTTTPSKPDKPEDGFGRFD